MNKTIREFAPATAQQLKLDRDASVLRGVKLLGAVSKNGRRYSFSAIRRAVPLYENARVNVNHAAKGGPAGRGYEDRLGVIRGARVEEGEGIFGDLHFNPKHQLAEQLMWDAQHAPQNVGFSHDVMAKVRHEEAGEVVEEIIAVKSVDLVADPATTSGLFESCATAVEPDQRPSPSKGLTPEDIEPLLQEHELPTRSDDPRGAITTPTFMAQLVQCASLEDARRLIEDRARLVTALREEPRQLPQAMEQRLFTEAHREPVDVAAFARALKPWE